MSTASLTPVDEQEASWANATEEHLNATEPSTQVLVDPSWNDGLRIEMRRAVTQFEGTDLSRRPAIPRINTSKELAIMVAIMNADTPDIELVVDLESWQILVYCGAVAVMRILGMDVEVEAGKNEAEAREVCRHGN